MGRRGASGRGRRLERLERGRAALVRAAGRPAPREVAGGRTGGRAGAGAGRGPLAHAVSSAAPPSHPHRPDPHPSPATARRRLASYVPGKSGRREAIGAGGKDNES